MNTIENQFLKVSARNLCAELISIYYKPENREILWQANPDVWPWYAPNLFPVVGGCLDNEIIVDSNKYPLERHGFCRKSTFELVEKTENSLKFSLESSPKSLSQYPFDFKFEIEYIISGKYLTIKYIVANCDNKAMFFSVGAHPAFNVPFNKNEEMEDYYLEFEKNETFERHLLSPEGYFNGKKEIVARNTNILPLSKALFANDALVFKNLHSRKVCIKSHKNSQSLQVSYADFDYLGIWSKPGSEFVCIEPWLGCADTLGKKVSLNQKEGIISLAQSQTHISSFEVSV
jgi:galactose mutarotase-like enzyme